MPRASEILFVDPSVSDIGTILGNLRPEVEAILLDTDRPAARQMAEVLSDHRDLDAIHIIAHGAPGRVSLAAGAWSTQTVRDEAKDLAAIGRALADGRQLQLWSCDTALGPAGAAFIETLARATGSDVAAATGRIGAASKGGTWELAASARRPPPRAPLSAAAIAAYESVLPAKLTSSGRGERHAIFGKWPAGTTAGTYFIVLNNGGAQQVIGKFIVPVNVAGTFAISEALPAGTYIVGAGRPEPGTITVFNGKWTPGGQAGTWSLGDFDPGITATMNSTEFVAASNYTTFSGAR